ncbi:uncharacterized protein LOC102705457 [Oryza brachyantha]|uniref:uncharacterized protein LOC102705457 n=1 Tax=Oryza brachyantha TaxID=4533 RepID=UPI001ADA70E1|nr:uncharacterized protein LOC102705457 [Oryza brachyantha]
MEEGYLHSPSGPSRRHFRMLGSLRGMEVFEDVVFARLRSYECGTYLHADEDGRSVYHGSLALASHNAVWAVERRLVASGDGDGDGDGAAPTLHLLFRGAYGRYLGGPDARDGDGNGERRCRLLKVTQRDRDAEEVDAIMWRAIACGRWDVFEEHDARGVTILRDRSGRYLRGNKGFLSCRRSVSVDGNANKEATLLWELVRVPPSLGRPQLPFATEADLGVTVCLPTRRREIRYVRADDEGNIVGSWESFPFKGKSVRILRDSVVRRVLLNTPASERPQLGENFTLCVRAGLHGHLSPLLINLPRSLEALNVVLLRENSTADNELIFPDVDALPDQPSFE